VSHHNLKIEFSGSQSCCHTCLQLFLGYPLRRLQKGLLETISCGAIHPENRAVLVLVKLCIPRGELRLADPTDSADDEYLAWTFLGQVRLELLLDLVELCITPYKLPEWDTSQAERYLVSIYRSTPVSM
jgi:hypothetical protein